MNIKLVNSLIFLKKKYKLRDKKTKRVRAFYKPCRQGMSKRSKKGRSRYRRLWKRSRI